MKKARVKKSAKVVVIGGGTGVFTVLSGLKRYPLELSAVISMADDGGSTGILREEFGILPPGMGEAATAAGQGISFLAGAAPLAGATGLFSSIGGFLGKLFK